ncbi:MAG: class I SAM-dependent methyltransferase [Bacteroidota bacterium]
MEKLTNCPVCLGEKFKEVLSCADYTTTKEEFVICQCSDCSFQFTNPRPDINESGKYYQSEDYISHTDSKKGLLNKLYQIARDYMIATKYKSTVKKYNAKSLVDYGCGTGDFLKYCIDKGHNAIGLEIDDSARKIALNKGCKEVYEPSHLSNISSDSADIITLWHVLEHIHDLHPTVKHFNRILNESGTLVIAVPNHESHDAKHYGKYWAAYDVPRHLYHFNIASMIRLMNDEGFKLIETKTMRLDPFYIALLSNKYQSGGMNPTKAIYIGLVSNLKTLFNIKNSSSIIYVFKKQ